MPQRLSNEAASAMLNALTALLSGGKLKLYNGLQPASADTPVTTQTLIVTMELPTPAWDIAVDGEADLLSPISGIVEVQSRPSWGRMEKADGSPEQDVTVGSVSGNIQIAGSFLAGAMVTIDSLVLTQRKTP